MINNKKQIDGRVLVKKQKPTVQSVRQKQDRKQQLILKKKKKTDTQHIIAKKETKQQTAKKQYQETGKKSKTRKNYKELLKGKKIYFRIGDTFAINDIQKYVRASGKKQLLKKEIRSKRSTIS